MHALDKRQDTRLRVSQLWRVRNDIHNVVAYRCSVLSHVYRVLSPFEACIVPLLNGGLTLKELREQVFYVFNPKGEAIALQLENSLNLSLESLASEKDLLSIDGPCSPSLAHGLSALVPDLGNYTYPSWRLERPLSLMVAFTNACLANCQYCYAERRHVPAASLERWVGLFDDAVANGIYLVDIAGGDVFSREDAFELLGEMTARDFNFFVSTKSFLTEDNAQRLAEIGIGRLDIQPHLIRRVQISVDSADPDTASWLVGRSEFLSRAITTVENLLKAGISPRVKGVLTAYNIDGVEDVVRLFSSRGVNEFDFVLYSRSHYRHNDQLFSTREQKQHLEEAYLRIRDRYPSVSISVQTESESFRKDQLVCDDWDKRAVCSGGRSNMIIQPNGDVTLCDQTPHNDSFVVGNVFRDGIVGVWKSRALEEFLYPPRERFKDTVCFDCESFDKCHLEKGYCYRDALFYFGSIYDAPPECGRQDKMPLRKL